jgi:hypothetical protein
MKTRPGITAALLALLAAPALAQQPQPNQTKIEVEAVGASGTSSFVRPEIKYEISFGIKGKSFVELYPDSYFGKTTIDKDLPGHFSATGQLVYNSEENDKIGFGFSYNREFTRGSFGVTLLPAWFDRTGYTGKATLAASGQLNLTKGFYIDGFGQVKLNKSEWGYGEVGIGKGIGRFSVGYKLLLKGDGNLIPKPYHAFSVGYKLR